MKKLFLALLVAVAFPMVSMAQFDANALGSGGSVVALDGTATTMDVELSYTPTLDEAIDLLVADDLGDLFIDAAYHWIIRDKATDAILSVVDASPVTAPAFVGIDASGVCTYKTSVAGTLPTVGPDEYAALASTLKIYIADAKGVNQLWGIWHQETNNGSFM